MVFRIVVSISDKFFLDSGILREAPFLKKKKSLILNKPKISATDPAITVIKIRY